MKRWPDAVPIRSGPNVSPVQGFVRARELFVRGHLAGMRPTPSDGTTGRDRRALSEPLDRRPRRSATPASPAAVPVRNRRELFAAVSRQEIAGAPPDSSGSSPLVPGLPGPVAKASL